MCLTLSVSTAISPWKNCHNLADEIFKCIFVNENFCILIWISLTFVHRDQIDNKSAFIQGMAWCWTRGKPLPKPMVAQHKCGTRGRWVKASRMLLVMMIYNVDGDWWLVYSKEANNTRYGDMELVWSQIGEILRITSIPYWLDTKFLIDVKTISIWESLVLGRLYGMSQRLFAQDILFTWIKMNLMSYCMY